MRYFLLLLIAVRTHLSSISGHIPRGTAALSCAPAVVALLAACGGSPGEPPPPVPGSTLVLGPQETCSRDLGAEAPDVTVYGAGAGDYLADRFSLATGDFNDDGFADVLVGAPLADGPGDARENAGEAYIIFGSAMPTATVDLAQGAPVTISGENPGDNLGFTVASGDVNGDGRDDAIVGARFAAAGQDTATGKAYVFFGREKLAGALDTAAGEQDATVIGRGGDYLTMALAAGDVDGDEIDDMLLGTAGSRGPSGDRLEAGGVVVVLGATDLGLIDLRQEDPFFRVHGAASGDNIPNHIAAGDLDGDGSDEMVIGAPLVDGDLREDGGAAYIVPVPEDGGELDLAAGSGFTKITGGARKDMLGFQVAAGDVNGDGVADAVIGARDADGVGDALNNAGEVHVFFGGQSLPAGRDLLGEKADVTIVGSDANDSLGFSVSTGDVNGDAIVDVLAGAPIADGCDNARTDAGDGYAVFGRADWPEGITLKGAGDLTWLGAEEGDDLGFSITSGDFNGDSVPDVVLGALQADGPDNSRPDGGELYIIFSAKE